VSAWTTHDIPPQQGRKVVITGATGGLGYETALALARAGADVLMTGRNEAKGKDALSRLQAAVPGAAVRYAHLDLADLASVEAFAGQLASEWETISKLIFWPSTRVDSPARSTAEMWTKTSAPPASGWMKPKPLVALNHLTVPVAIKIVLAFALV